MSFKRYASSLLSVLVALVWGATAQGAPYLLTGNSAGQLQIGTGLPLPIGTAGIFVGGMTSVNGGTMCDPILTMMCDVSPDGPGTAYWPVLNVPVAPKVSTGGSATTNIDQTAGGKLVIPPGALFQSAPGGPPAAIGVFNTNAVVYQVATTITYSWPVSTATLSAGGGPGVAGQTMTPVTLSTSVSAAGAVIYNGGPAAFGGPAQFAVLAGPSAGLNKLPPNGSKIPIATVWINAGGKLPASGTKVGLVGASAMAGVGQPGAPATAPAAMTSFGFVTKGNGRVNVKPGQLTPMGTMTFTFSCCTLTANGKLNNSSSPYMGSINVGGPFLTNMATFTKGFPWTTGLITVTASAAVPPEVFWQSGTDMRVAGAGNVSLVAGAIGQRNLSGANANRGWLSLPEPGALLGAGAALGALALCHGLVRRRARN